METLPDGTQAGFLRATANAAAAVEYQYKIPARISQSAWWLETKYGTSGIFRETRNLGMITAEGSWAREDGQGGWYPLPGHQIYVSPSKELINGQLKAVTRAFRKYDSMTEAALDWGRLITAYPRYAKAYNAALADDEDTWAREMDASGYSTRKGDYLSVAGIAREIDALA